MVSPPPDFESGASAISPPRRPTCNQRFHERQIIPLEADQPSAGSLVRLPFSARGGQAATPAHSESGLYSPISPDYQPQKQWTRNLTENTAARHSCNQNRREPRINPGMNPGRH